MRQAFVVPVIFMLTGCVTAFGLSACQTTADPSALDQVGFKNDCENAFAAANQDLHVKYSKEMETASSLACYYGHTDAIAQISCSIPVDLEPIFDEKTNDTGGLRDKSAALLVASEGIGNHMAHKDAMLLLKSGITDKDSDQCLKALHDRVSDRQTFRDIFANLKRHGY